MTKISDTDGFDDFIEINTGLRPSFKTSASDAICTICSIYTASSVR